MGKLFVVWVSLLFSNAIAEARTIEVDLTTKPADSSSTAVLNLATGQVHLAYVVDRTEGAGGGVTGGTDEDDTVNIGDGSDGDFNATTYSTWDTAAGADPSTVTLDTSHTYQFKNFVVANGVTLRGSGTAPLRIKVQGTATIAGTIDLNGGAGLFSSSTAAAGATGCCGGAQGGIAGDPFGTTAGGAGGSADGAVGGGAGGAAGNPAGGGGGAGNATAGLTGATGTVPGNTYADEFIATLLGGSGGGGGGAQTTGSLFGASGGAGGGVLEFHVGGKITIESTGIIRANGGMGGQASGAGVGNGGGGSGGGLILFSGSTIENAGMLRATGGPGAGGTTGAGTGEGSDGRIRYCSSIGDITPVGAGSDQPAPLTAPFGQTFYRSLAQPYILTSGIYDSGNSAPTYTSATATTTLPAGTGITVEMAGSSDRFVNDNTGWQAITDLSALAGKRYYRFRALLTTASRSSTPLLTGLALELEDREQPTFQFKLVSCAGVQPLSLSAENLDVADDISRAIQETGLYLGLWLVLTLWVGRRYSSESTTKYSTPPSIQDGP